LQDVGWLALAHQIHPTECFIIFHLICPLHYEIDGQTGSCAQHTRCQPRHIPQVLVTCQPPPKLPTLIHIQPSYIHQPCYTSNTRPVFIVTCSRGGQRCESAPCNLTHPLHSCHCFSCKTATMPRCFNYMVYMNMLSA
jgi:hypothetical protein